MSPYAPVASAGLAELENAILAELAKASPLSMANLLATFASYGSAAVKTAVWRLIDRGKVRLEPDRRLARAA